MAKDKTTPKAPTRRISSITSFGVGITVLVTILAVFLKRSYDEELRTKMQTVLTSLLSHEKSAKVAPATRIAIGYGACKDLFIDGKTLLQDDEPPKDPAHFLQIDSHDQLLRMYAYFFRHGAAAERFISKEELFTRLVKKAETFPEHRFALGGNAPVMASRFALEGADVLLAAKMTPALKSTLHKDVQLAPGSEVDQDDIHLILEYKREEEWGPYKSPRANRFIVHSDENNPTVSSAENFDEGLKNFDPNLFVVSGLQMMDNYPFKEGQREARLKKIQSQMSVQPPSTRVHFEMASFVDETLFDEIARDIVPYADSLGMNEQELPNLRSMLLHGNISLVADSNPRTAVVLDQMRDLYRHLSGSGPRPLTRIHVHTLAYQVIMVKRGSAWKNTKSAAAKASLTANRHVCASNWIDLSKAFLLMDDSFSTSAATSASRIAFDNERPVACWEENDLDVQICLAPNLVCAEAQQTAGGGDNVSAAGIVLQV